MHDDQSLPSTVDPDAVKPVPEPDGSRVDQPTRPRPGRVGQVRLIAMHLDFSPRSPDDAAPSTDLESARDPATAADALALLAQSADPEVRAWVCGHPRAPL